MTIGGLQKVTLVDYPGKLACTVFLSGCNFRCPFCYSKELVLEPEIKSHPQISEDYFFDFLNEKKGMLEGCVVCGGEHCCKTEIEIETEPGEARDTRVCVRVSATRPAPARP